MTASDTDTAGGVAVKGESITRSSPPGVAG